MKSVSAYGDTKSPKWHLGVSGLFLRCFDPVLKVQSFEKDIGLRLSFFLSYSDLLPTHCRCRELLLHLITLSDTHTYIYTQYIHTRARAVGLLWTRDRPNLLISSRIFVVSMCEMPFFQLFCKAYVSTGITGSWTLWCLTIMFIPWQERK
jgi:hypothetical protein